MAKLPKCPVSGKVRFPSQSDAIHRILIISRKRGGALRCYRCPSCSGFHLTKTPLRNWENAS